MKWKAPKSLLYTHGRHWAYQPSEDTLMKLKDSLPKHYKNWKEEKTDKQMHPLYLGFSGPGTGKSRLLNEFQQLCIMAASDPDLKKLLEEAYVFHVMCCFFF